MSYWRGDRGRLPTRNLREPPEPVYLSIYLSIYLYLSLSIYIYIYIYIYDALFCFMYIHTSIYVPGQVPIIEGVNLLEACTRRFPPRASLTLASRHSLMKPAAPVLREMGGVPRHPAPRDHLLVWTVKPSPQPLPLHRWALDRQSFPRGSTAIVECRPPLGALPLSLTDARDQY